MHNLLLHTGNKKGVYYDKKYINLQVCRRHGNFSYTLLDCFYCIFKYGQHFINSFYMVGGAIGLILAILYMLVVLISSTICILLPLIDLFIFKPKSTDKKVSKIRVIIECLFVNFYLLNAIPICFYFISDQISRL